MRLLLMGAFSYPHHQGSQVYFQEQALALRSAGAEVHLLTYGRGDRPGPEDRAGWRALDGFSHWKSPEWSAPHSFRAGPNWRKPLADLALGKTLYDATASKMTQNAPYDAILTHNVEAALIADWTFGPRHRRPAPLIYCAHTLMGQELLTYAKRPKINPFSATPGNVSGVAPPSFRRFGRVIDRIGDRLDRALARRADGWIALTQSTHRVMRKASTAPGALIPPPLPDPRQDLDRLDPAATARKYELESNGFALYSGNLDGYQELFRLGGLDRDAKGLPSVVVASHDPDLLKTPALLEAGVTLRFVPTAAEMRALIEAARSSLILRRSEGGYPIKLANSLAAGTVPITYHEREWGLTDQKNAWVVGNDAEAPLAEAIRSLDRNPDRAAQLGEGARALYEQNHSPEKAARETLELVERVLRQPRVPKRKAAAP